MVELKHGRGSIMQLKKHIDSGLASTQLGKSLSVNARKSIVDAIHKKIKKGHGNLFEEGSLA